MLCWNSGVFRRKFKVQVQDFKVRFKDQLSDFVQMTCNFSTLVYSVNSEVLFFAVLAHSGRGAERTAIVLWSVRLPG